MVHLRDTSTSTPRDGASVFAILKHRWENVLLDQDLDACLGTLVLTSAFRDPALSPWGGSIAALRQSVPLPSALRRTREVATLGCLLALGACKDRRDEFREAAARELRRPACPPVPTAHDDDRLILGIAAGIGTLPAEERLSLDPVCQDGQIGIERALIELWARSLASAHLLFDPALARKGMQLLSRPVAASAPVGDAGIARFWLATRLMCTIAQWSDGDLKSLEDYCIDGKRSAAAWAAEPELLRPLDLVLLLDALSAAPAERFARQDAFQGILAVIDAFESAASVLANRQRGRSAVTIEDEYDVQDLFRALALGVVPDIEPEDPAPKVATMSSRLDFTSKRSCIGFEMKHVKSEAQFEKVRGEILIDEATYYMHPFVETVVAFIYDPGQHISPDRRTHVEDDLSRTVTIDGRTVVHVVRIRG